MPALSGEMVRGHSDVTGIADDVDDPSISWVERLMTLEDAWRQSRSDIPTCSTVNIGHISVHVRKSYWFIRMRQIAN